MEEGPKACDAPTVQETELQEATIKAINPMVRCSSSMKEILAENISLAMTDDNSGELEEINAVLAAKQKELVKLPMQTRITLPWQMRSTGFEKRSRGSWWQRRKLQGIRKRLKN